MRLFWAPKTRAVRALWMLEELGVPFERVAIDIRDPAAKADPGFRAASPLGKVPALEDGATRLSDSGAICGYLADQYPAASLAPPIGDPDRGRYLQWLAFTNSNIEPAMLEKFVPDLPKNPGAFGWSSFDAMVTTLRTGLAPGPWILGERFCAADVLLGTAVRFMRSFGALELPGDLAAYVARCEARPACQRALAAEES